MIQVSRRWVAARTSIIKSRGHQTINPEGYNQIGVEPPDQTPPTTVSMWTDVGFRLSTDHHKWWYPAGKFIRKIFFEMHAETQIQYPHIQTQFHFRIATAGHTAPWITYCRTNDKAAHSTDSRLTRIVTTNKRIARKVVHAPTRFHTNPSQCVFSRKFDWKHSPSSTAT